MSVDEATCTRIVVKNLPKQTTAEELAALFTSYGSITETPFVSSNSRLKGKFGFLNFDSHASAVKALVLSGKVLEGQAKEGGIIVELATKPGSSKKSSEEGGGAAAAAGGAAAGAASAGSNGDRKKRRNKKSASASSAGESSQPAAAAGAATAGQQQQQRGRGRQPRPTSSTPASTEPAAPSTRLYIANLPKSSTAEELTALLTGIGPLKSEVFISSNARISGHFAFAEMASVAAATKAVDTLHGHVMEGQGRTGGLVVQFAREPQNPSSDAPRARGRGRAAVSRTRRPRAPRRDSQRKEKDTTPQEPAPPAPRLYVANLPASYDSAMLQTLMSTAGKVTDECFVSSNARLSGRFGFVVFADIPTATKALEMFQGKELEGQGRPGGLVVQYAREGKGLPPAADGAKN